MLSLGGRCCMGEILACMGSLATCLGVSVGMSACVKLCLLRSARQCAFKQTPTSDVHTQVPSTQRKSSVLDVWMMHALIMVVVSYLVVCAAIVYVFLLHPTFVLQAGIGGVMAIAIYWLGYTSFARGFWGCSMTADRERGEQ